MHEYIRTNHSYSKRKNGYQSLGARKKIPSAIGTKSTDYSIGSIRNFQPRYCHSFKHLTSNRSIMARTLFIFPITWFGKRCSSSWPTTKDFSKESHSHYKCHFAYDTTGCYSLEYSQHGKSTWNQQCNGTTNMENSQSKTSFNQNIQTQQGQTFYRKTLRCCWTLSKSSRQSHSSLCGREKSNTGTRTHSTIVPYETRNSSQANTRLYTARYYNIVCGTKHARWNRDRRLHAKTQAPGIYSISTAYKHKNPARFRASFDCRQLRNTQTSSCSNMDQKASSFSFPFYPDFKLVVKHGRTMVRRNNIKKNSSRFI